MVWVGGSDVGPLCDARAGWVWHGVLESELQGRDAGSRGSARGDSSAAGGADRSRAPVMVEPCVGPLLSEQGRVARAGGWGRGRQRELFGTGTGGGTGCG